MKRKLYFGMASIAIIALIFTVNTTKATPRNNVINAKAQTVNVGKIADSAAVKTNTVVLTYKDQAAVNKKTSAKPQIDVPINMEVEKGDQKNADKGSSPWKLDPVFVAQVFTSLKVSPNGIQGDYPVKEKELKLINSTDGEAVVEVRSNKTTIKKVYLKRIIKQDKTGIWTVVGYDLVSY